MNKTVGRDSNALDATINPQTFSYLFLMLLQLFA